VIHSKANNSAAPWWISIMFFFRPFYMWVHLI